MRAPKSEENAAASQAWLFPYASLMTLFCGTLLILQSAPKEDLAAKTKPTEEISSSADKSDAAIDADPVGSHLKQFISDHDGLDFIVKPDRWIVRLSATAFFDEGKAYLKASQLSVLDDISGILKLDEMLDRIEVQGHTDDKTLESEDYPTNWELSTARATWVVRYLVEHQGYDPHKLSASGFGQYSPLEGNLPSGKETAPELTKLREKNRRIDLVVWHHK